MNETVYVYIVHSDINENNIYAEFKTEAEALDYARRNIDELTYVDRVEVALDEAGEIIEMFDSETIWGYYEEDEDSVEEDDDYWNQLAREEEERKEDEALLGDPSWFEDLDTDKLVETLEENEDIVECKECFELFPKEACTKIAIGYICPECGKIHSHEEPEFEIDSIPDVLIAGEDTFKIDFPELERTEFGNDMIPDEPTPEVENNLISEPECVGPECEAPVTKDETITKLVIDEHEAIDGYEKAKIEIEANSELDEKEKEEILDTIEHIKEEEVEHIEELEELVDEVEETKAGEPTEESESEDESEVLVEEITELDVVDGFEDEFEGLEDILEEAINTNVLTEANWGGFIGIGAASVEDKLDAFFSTEGGKEGKFKYNKNYGSNFELKEYNAKTKEFKDLSEADAKYINLIDNEYEQVRTAKKDAEKLSKSDGAKDKYIAVCIREYKETDTPSIYIYQNGKLKADHSETKIKYFEAKYDGVKGNSSNSTQRDLEDTNYAFAPAEVTFELSNLQEKEISVLKGTNNISDEKLIKTFKFGFTKGIPTNIFTFSRISLNKYKLKLVKEELDKITDESAKEKLFAAEGIKLKLIIEGKTEATCTIIIKKDNPTETPAEQPVEQPHVETTQGPTREQLKGTYRLLVALLGTKDKAAEYITVEGKGINAKYNLVQGKTFDDIKAKIKELQKGVLGESLTEHVNEEHPAIESDQKLVGTDNAVVDCKVNKVITHSEDEKPVDCEDKKKPLEKPLTESLNKDQLQVMEEYLKATKFASLDTEWEDEGDFYTDIVGAYLDYSAKTKTFTLGLSIYHASEDNNAEYPESHTDEEEFSYDSLAEMYEDEECKEILDRIYKDNLAKLTKSLSEETHAKYAKPEGNRVQAFNNALKYAKQYNKPFIYGYTNHTGKFFAAETPMKVTGSPAEAEKEFRQQYKTSKVVYIAYPDKEFVREGLFTKAEQEEYNMDEDGNSLDSYDTYIRCGFCDEIYTKSECKYERNLGWLCPSCEAAIYSRGEKLTFVDPDEFLD